MRDGGQDGKGAIGNGDEGGDEHGDEVMPGVQMEPVRVGLL